MGWSVCADVKSADGKETETGPTGKVESELRDCLEIRDEDKREVKSSAGLQLSTTGMKVLSNNS